jgi:16S rRNA (cytosine1402-N4)-methyltransferase
MEFIHTPVLQEEVLTLLGPRKAGELMVDATLGEGGHSFAFLSRFNDLKIIGIDADADIMERAKERLAVFGERVRFYSSWSQDFFAEYPRELKRPDTILLDLGVSLYHYEKSGRGFSFRKDEKLDMRLDATRGQSAAELIARLPGRELAGLLYNNAGERFSRQIARLIVEERSRGQITNTAVLAEIVERAVPPSYRHTRVHPATKTFQALRIAVNGELSGLPCLLENSLRVLANEGRLGVISFHSLEDRIVKNFFREKNKTCTCPPEMPIGRCGEHRVLTILTRKGLSPNADEIERNPSSRSARLRVVEKKLDKE